MTAMVSARPRAVRIEADHRGLKLAHAQSLANELIDLLAPACSRIEVGGAVRRRRPAVRGIGIVAAPLIQKAPPPVFGAAVDQLVEHNALEELIDRINADERTAMLLARAGDDGRTAWGPKSKRAAYCGYAVDLYSVIAPAQWGWLLAQRTGPASFGRYLVDRASKWGWKFVDGELRARGGSLIPTPTEIDLFRVLQMPAVAPWQRDRYMERIEAAQRRELQGAVGSQRGWKEGQP